MIRVRQIKVPLEDENLKKYTAKKLNTKAKDISQLKINKKSIDARKKQDIHYVYEVDIKIKNENKYLKNKDVLKTPKEKYIEPIMGNKKLKTNPIIIGAGPAGLFAALLLSQKGYKPIVIERGEKIEDRVKTVEKFWQEGILNKNSNVQFGEGGAGTFSDGKLNTLVKDKNYRMKKVFETFVKCGADEEIMYLNKPHIGTDMLRNVIINLRKQIINLGGKFIYNEAMTDINIKEGKIESITLNNKETLPCEVLVLAIGHSSRDTVEMLYNKNLNITSKPFAIGIRLQHTQNLINNAQYGDVKLPPADYKLTYKTKENRAVYSFCMCPGGYVVNASSEENLLAINGMSNHKRNSGIANSAIIVAINEKDFGQNPLDGIKFQRKLEKKAFELAKGKIAVQTLKDFKENKTSKEITNYKFKGDYNFTDINELYPAYITKSLKEAIDYFDTKIKGFADDSVTLAAPETRTSSPVRILRDDNLEANIKGIYPCGEGAGYAGGITTSAMDGLKVAEAIINKYRP